MIADQYWRIQVDNLRNIYFWMWNSFISEVNDGGTTYAPADFQVAHVSNFGKKDLELLNAVLIKKSYEEKGQKKHVKPRAWKLESMNMKVDNSNRKLDEEKMNTECMKSS